MLYIDSLLEKTQSDANLTKISELEVKVLGFRC